MDNRTDRRWIWAYVAVAAAVAVATAGVTALLVNIFERKQEAKEPFLKLVQVTEDDVDPVSYTHLTLPTTPYV